MRFQPDNPDPPFPYAPQLAQDEVDALTSKFNSLGLVGRSQLMIGIYWRARQVSASDANVLIPGESGTGKELFAHAIHELSPRRGKPFVPINCAAIPEALFESEVFGHEAEAFTGATKRKIGLIESADGGTVFLDEIGELTPTTQAKLLRVLEERMLLRVGASDRLPVDIRIIAATNRDLTDLVQAQRFRLDLLHRINTVTIELPPLRTRGEDIEKLALHFLKQLATTYKKDVREIAPEAMVQLQAHTWPGNVRELRNTIESAVIFANGPRISHFEVHFAALRESLPSGEDPHPKAPWPTVTGVPLGKWEEMLLDFRQSCARDAVAAAGGNREEAARKLGVSTDTLRRMLNRENSKRRRV